MYSPPKNLQSFNGRFRSELQQVQAAFKSSADSHDALERIAALQAYLRLRNFVNGWCNAFAFCQEIDVIRQDSKYHLQKIVEQYEVENQELKAASDKSTQTHTDNAGFFSCST